MDIASANEDDDHVIMVRTYGDLKRAVKKAVTFKKGNCPNQVFSLQAGFFLVTISKHNKGLSFTSANRKPPKQNEPVQPAKLGKKNITADVIAEFSQIKQHVRPSVFLIVGSDNIYSRVPRSATMSVFLYDGREFEHIVTEIRLSFRNNNN